MKICRELDRTEKGYVTVSDVVRKCVIVSAIIFLMYFMLYRGTRHLWFYMRHPELGVLSNGDFVGTASAIMLLGCITIVGTIFILEYILPYVVFKTK